MTVTVRHPNTRCRPPSSLLQTKLFQKHERLLVAVSGGVDSLVLLHLLSRLRHRYSWHLEVAHINHQLRGKQSEADQELVRRCCARWGILLHVRRLQLLAGGNLQARARQARYEALWQIVEDQKLDSLVLAHHADDQLELFWLRLLAGVGLAGIGGMSSLQVTEHGRRLVRPLLASSKSQLLEYAKAQRLKFRQDRSNRNRDYERNRLRLDVLPKLRRLLPTLDTAVLNLMSNLRDEQLSLDHLVRGMAQQWSMSPSDNELVVDLKPLRPLDGNLQRHLLQTWLNQWRQAKQLPAVVLNRRKSLALQEVIANTGGSQELHLGHGIWVYRDYDRLHLRNSVRPRRAAWRHEVLLPSLGQQKVVECDGQRVVICRKKCFTATQLEAFGGVVLPANPCGTALTLRSWQSGDRLRVPHSGQQKKLAKVFIDNKISRLDREKAVLVVKDQQVLALLSEKAGKIVDRDYLVDSTKAELITVHIEESVT